MSPSPRPGPSPNPPPDPAALWRAGPLADCPDIAHGFFGRQGGVSEGLYSTLNCSFGSADEPERVAHNRGRAMARLGVEPDRLTTVRQVHSATVVAVERPWARDDAPAADALVSATPGVALGILTADCVPVLFADAQAQVIGAAHAGWRGALGGILDATVAAMQALGAARQRLVAGIGPAIALASYEVGPDLRDPFLAADPANAAWFRPAARPGHFFFDLPGYVAHRLAGLGVATVTNLSLDTCADEARFFSYRRSCHARVPDYGRQLSAIALLAPT